MPRPPNSIFEQRIDFERIEKQREAREAAMVKELRSQLFRMQNTVLKFVEEELARKKLQTAATRFRMPRAAKYREIIQRKMTQAYLQGNHDVTSELDLRNRRISQPERVRIKEQADALTAVHLGELQGNLKREWAKAMTPPVDKTQLVYVTKKVFADFAGWEQPVPE